MAEERSTEFARVGAALMRLRPEIPPRLGAEFAMVEEAALRGALLHDMGEHSVKVPPPVPLRRVK